jgi:hypothetical protein
MQKIYSRYEYPIGLTPSSVIFDEYRNMSGTNNGVTVSGLDVAIREGTERTAIILTYDKESDTYMQLKFAGMKNIKVNRIGESHG